MKFLVWFEGKDEHRLDKPIWTEEEIPKSTNYHPVAIMLESKKWIATEKRLINSRATMSKSIIKLNKQAIEKIEGYKVVFLDDLWEYKGLTEKEIISWVQREVEREI
jgi:hypothetical protein